MTWQTRHYRSLNIRSTAWVSPELSIRASALTPDTVLVAVRALHTDNITGLEVTYSNSSVQNWTQVVMDEDERYALVTDLLPQTTYYFKASGTLRLGPRTAVTHVVTPRSATPPPSSLKVETAGDTSIMVSWNQKNPDEVKGYKVTVEKQQGDESYRVQTEKLTLKKELKVDGISQDGQYKVTVKAFDLEGLGQPSEAVMYPPIPKIQPTTPSDCPIIESMKSELDPSYELNVRVVRQTPSRLRVTWFLSRGDLNNLGRFRILFVSSSGRKLIDRNLRKNQRSITLHPVTQETEYLLAVKALDTEGKLLAEEQVNLSSKATDSGSSEAGLLLDADEIRDKQARLVWALKNVDPSKLKTISLKAQRDGPKGVEIVKRGLAPNRKTIFLNNLLPNSVYYITVEAIGQDDKSFLSSALTLKTPALGGIGEPIIGAPPPTVPAFSKANGQLKITSVDMMGDKAVVMWEDLGKPIPDELKVDVRVVVRYRKTHRDGSESRPKMDVNEPGASGIVLTGLDRHFKYKFEARYITRMRGVGNILTWSAPVFAEESSS
ncbi:down syndrome cell adhesion molecule homolog [Elysia marginata]|uniref:Down syndrome cell adhesion molecule homolog n=1 Tax=Elysia marginata TaxID=1093978 RepID=A0AAV4J921_9GAST|nr:down syndrome cell adhesion molecule homolog [Elysia marginata]